MKRTLIIVVGVIIGLIVAFVVVEGRHKVLMSLVEYKDISIEDDRATNMTLLFLDEIPKGSNVYSTAQCLNDSTPKGSRLKPKGNNDRGRKHTHNWKNDNENKKLLSIRI